MIIKIQETEWTLSQNLMITSKTILTNFLCRLDSISQVKSYKSTNFLAISKLSQQLEEEKREREKMQKEIEELKKLNSDLCSAILSSGVNLKK